MSEVITIKDLNGHYAVLDLNEVMKQVDTEKMMMFGLPVKRTMEVMSEKCKQYHVDDTDRLFGLLEASLPKDVD